MALGYRLILGTSIIQLSLFVKKYNYVLTYISSLKAKFKFKTFVEIEIY